MDSKTKKRIWILHEHGWSSRRIAKKVGLSKTYTNTIIHGIEDPKWEKKRVLRVRKWSAHYYWKNWERDRPIRRKAARDYYRQNREKVLRDVRKRSWQIKLEVFAAYGGAFCRCCGESEIGFLSIDHIHGGGRQHRKEIGVKGGIDMYLWLRRNNYPKGFQILCFNCNLGRHKFKGVCPHKRSNNVTFKA